MVGEVLTWVTGRRQLGCRVCGDDGQADLIATITALDVVDLEAVRCRNCASIQLADEPRDFSPTVGSIDTYVEWGAGIGTIAEIFTGVDHSRSLSMLDVGCNYPFAMDLARFLYGWQVVGVEPSPAGVRGARELDVHVLNEYLTPDSTLNGPFDLIIASEVVEHVTDPVGFLSAIRDQMSPSGTLLLTTPAAEVVDPGESSNDAILAISPGYHVFVASVHGMELLLERAGFAAWNVERHRGSLRVAAYVSQSAADLPASIEPVSSDDLERYYDWRGSRSPAKSALALGMSNRLFRLRVARGEFVDAERTLAGLIRLTRAIHRIDLRRPSSAYLTEKARVGLPWSVIGSSFSMGMFELIHREDAVRAAEYFSLSERVASVALERMQVVDGDTADISFQAPFHRALALAQFDAPAAAALAIQLSQVAGGQSGREPNYLNSRQCRIFTELVVRGTFSIGSGLPEAVAACAPELARHDDTDLRVAGLDALFCLGMAALQTGEAPAAIEWFSLCLDDCQAMPTSAHSEGLIVESMRHLDLARARLSSERSKSAGAIVVDLDAD